MPVNLSIKNVPDDIAKELKRRAKQNHRSLQGELMCILEETVRPKKLSLKEFAHKIETLGFETPGDSVEIIRKERDVR